MSKAANDADDAGGRVYLRSYLTSLNAMLERPDVTDIYVNRPGEVWVETLGGATERHDAPGLDEPTLARLARQIAAISLSFSGGASRRKRKISRACRRIEARSRQRPSNTLAALR